MQGFTTRFEQQRGHWMVMDRDVPLIRTELDEVQVAMLSGNRVAGLLPLTVEEWNGTIRLRYQVTGSRMLSQAARMSPSKMDDWMTAVCALAECGEHCLNHMLDFERVLLDDDYIFIGEGWSELKLTYIPASIPAGQNDFRQNLERLLIRWLMRADNPDGAVLQRVLRVIAKPDFTPGMLRNHVRQYFGDNLDDERQSNGRSGDGLSDSRKEAITHRQPESRARVETKQREQSELGRNEGDQSYIEPIRAGSPLRSVPDRPSVELMKNRWFRSPAEEPQTLSGLLGTEERMQDDWKAVQLPGDMSIGRWRMILTAAGTISCSLTWRYLYAEHPGQRGLILALGITLACLGVCTYLWNGLKQSKPHNGRESARTTKEDGGCAGSSIGSQERASYSGASHANGSSYSNGSSHNGSDEDLNEPRHARFLKLAAGDEPIKGVRISKPASGGEVQAKRSALPELATVLLKPGGDATQLITGGANGRSGAARLVREAAGKTEVFELQGSSIIIGRSAEAAQVVDESNGISRAHLELMPAADGWVVKDLGSKNGSWLNGEPLVAYECYTLSEGDRLQAAGSLYRFRNLFVS